jgi:hypothetical protein
LLGVFVVLSFPTIRPSLTKLTKLSFPSLSHYVLFQDFHKSFLTGLHSEDWNSHWFVCYKP